MDKAKKKQIKKITSWVALGLVVALLAAMPLLAKREIEEDGPVASVHSGTVEKGSIDSFLRGGGTLTAKDAEDIEIPSGVKITEFLVKNGDVVAEGIPLAAVDKVSVMTAIVKVTETMDYLREQMEKKKDETVSSTVAATAGGRVKQIFAQPGDSVQDVMLEHGALAVLSLDSMMAVTVQSNAQITTGEKVQLTLADGAAVTGRVESNLDGVVTITVEDEGYEIGQSVAAATEAGVSIGTGDLYVHNAWKATAFTGTVSAVNAKAESEVYAGAALLTLTDTEFTAELEYLSNQHREYEELLQKLFRMHETGTIDAPCDGIVSGVDKDSAFLLAAEEADWEAQPLDNQGGGWKIVLLSNSVESCTGDKQCPLPADSREHLDGCIGACDKSIDCDADVHYASCIHSCDHADKAGDCNATGAHYKDCIKGCTNASKEGSCPSGKHTLKCIEYCISSDGTKPCPATGAHKKTCIARCSHADKSGVCEATAHHYADCIESCVSSEGASQECTATKHTDTCYFANMTYQATAAKVYAVGMELVVNADSSGTVYEVVRTAEGWALADGGKVNTQTLVGEETTLKVADPREFSSGDIILVVTGYKGEEMVWSDVVVWQKGEEEQNQQQKPSGGMDLSGMIAAMGGMGGFSGSYGGGTAAAEEPELFDLEGDVLMTVTPQSIMALTITLDEQDISRIHTGMTAQVKVEALRGQIFDAEVVEVGVTGTNNGGSSKFTAQLELDYAENMLDGMSATATIPLYTQMDVLTIPVKALVQQGAKTVVYTALNEETGEPDVPVEVTIGLSDGEMAQILSGLELGDTYYYSYYDVLELDTNAEVSRFSFG